MDEQTRRDALQRARALSRQDVMEELRRNGVNNLNDLIDVRLQAIKELEEGEREADEVYPVFIYRNFIVFTWW